MSAPRSSPPATTARLIPRGFGEIIELDWGCSLRVGSLDLAALRPAHYGARTALRPPPRLQQLHPARRGPPRPRRRPARRRLGEDRRLRPPAQPGPGRLRHRRLRQLGARPRHPRRGLVHVPRLRRRPPAPRAPLDLSPWATSTWTSPCSACSRPPDASPTASSWPRPGGLGGMMANPAVEDAIIGTVPPTTAGQRQWRPPEFRCNPTGTR